MTKITNRDATHFTVPTQVAYTRMVSTRELASGTCAYRRYVWFWCPWPVLNWRLRTCCLLLACWWQETNSEVCAPDECVWSRRRTTEVRRRAVRAPDDGVTTVQQILCEDNDSIAGMDGEDDGREQCVSVTAECVGYKSRYGSCVRGDDDDTDGEKRRCHANDVVQGVLFMKSNEKIKKNNK